MKLLFTFTRGRSTEHFSGSFSCRWAQTRLIHWWWEFNSKYAYMKTHKMLLTLQYTVYTLCLHIMCTIYSPISLMRVQENPKKKIPDIVIIPNLLLIPEGSLSSWVWVGPTLVQNPLSLCHGSKSKSTVRRISHSCVLWTLQHLLLPTSFIG